MKGAKIVNLASTSKRRLIVIGLLPLTVTIAGLAARTTFVVVEELGAYVVLGCQYIDAPVDAIIVMKQALVLKSGAEVPIQMLCARQQSATSLLERH